MPGSITWSSPTSIWAGLSFRPSAWERSFTSRQAMKERPRMCSRVGDLSPTKPGDLLRRNRRLDSRIDHRNSYYIAGVNKLRDGELGERAGGRSQAQRQSHFI